MSLGVDGIDLRNDACEKNAEKIPELKQNKSGEALVKDLKPR